MHSRSLSAKAGSCPTDIASMHWRDFERLVGEAFLRRGFKVTGFGIRGSVGTVDLALTRGGERFLVQCKHWRKPQIGVLLVRELNAAVSAVGARGGYLITAGGFAREARAFARHTPIELIDGQTLGAWVYPICKRAQTRHGQPAAPVTVGLQRASD